MRIIRYMAPDTRQSLRGIREQLGDDAVILSSKRTPQGVELTAAVDFDATRLENAAVPLAPEPAQKPAAPARAVRAPAPREVRAAVRAPARVDAQSPARAAPVTAAPQLLAAGIAPPPAAISAPA